MKAQHSIAGRNRNAVAHIPVRETGGGDADVGGQNVAVSGEVVMDEVHAPANTADGGGYHVPHFCADGVGKLFFNLNLENALLFFRAGAQFGVDAVSTRQPQTLLSMTGATEVKRGVWDLRVILLSRLPLAQCNAVRAFFSFDAEKVQFAMEHYQWQMEDGSSVNPCAAEAAPTTKCKLLLCLYEGCPIFTVSF